ncbi:MAG: COX15/CtaA family protein [Betaproteobacteria bacterium]|nr:COX15/CtaA family protein [Betaproteobacteria bacterium]
MSGLERGIVGLITLAVIVAVVLWIRHDRQRYSRTIAATTILTFVLIVLGAFVRLSDAGLGCPDWPGCYGNLTPAHSAEEIRAAEATQPGGPVSLAKAWKEMIHRYLAMIVGSLIAGIMFSAWYNRVRWQQSALLPAVIAAAVIFQAALGAWTVTMLLKPAIVTSHLLGGVTILGLLVWLLQRQPSSAKWSGSIMAPSAIRFWGWVALMVLFGQIVLGGWVSTNYAALACADFPTCHSSWLPQMDFANAFHVIRPLGVGPNGELLTIEALRAIHWTHRVGALVTVLVVGAFALRLLKIESGRKAAKMLIALLGLQVLLGVSNVWFSLPLLLAVAHNGVAALLFAWMLLIDLRLARGHG